MKSVMFAILQEAHPFQEASFVAISNADHLTRSLCLVHSDITFVWFRS